MVLLQRLSWDGLLAIARYAIAFLRLISLQMLSTDGLVAIAFL